MDDLPQDAGHATGNKGFAFAHLTLLIALVPPLFLLGVMMATHLGYIPFDLGFKTLALGYGPKLAMVALGLSVVSLLISLFMAPARCGPWALLGVIISCAVMGGYYYYQSSLKNYPPIADVATNWDRPLTFSDKLIEDRGANAMVVEDFPRVPRNESMDWGGKSIPQINAMTCPGAQPVFGKAVTEDQIAALLTANHYTVFGRAPWRVEATYQDNFFGFKSDIVVRMDPNRIDVRSTSRYNMPDLGANCRHVTRIVNAIKAL